MERIKELIYCIGFIAVGGFFGWSIGSTIGDIIVWFAS